MEVAAMNGLETLSTVVDQVMLLPDQYLRQGVTILRSVVHLALIEEEGRRDQALLFRQALESSYATVPQYIAAGQANQPNQPNQPEQWTRDFRAGDPDRQRIASSDAAGLIDDLKVVIAKLDFTNVTERQLVMEVQAAIDRVVAMGNHDPHEE
jgi:hypothetical protein